MIVDQVVTTRRGGPEVLEPRQTRLDRDPRKVLVRVAAAGVGPADIEMMRGRFYAQPKFPFVSGYDLVGHVEDGRPGLVAAMPRIGAWASAVEVDAATVVPVPDEVDPAVAVALVTNGVTAWQLAHRVAGVQPGHTVLVHGASGSVGALLTQFALLAGAKVIGTASAANLAKVASLGATPVDYRSDVSAQVRTRAPAGVDVVFDHLGGRALTRSYRLLARGGTVVSYGAASTVDQSGPAFLPYLGMAARVAAWEARRFLGLGRGRRARLYNVTPNARFREDLTKVFTLAAAKTITVEVTRYPLREASTAVRDLLDKSVQGKAVLVPG
ncbi:zinc-binding dehydrogenase [Actinokineospora sp.]|uniref:zinc-binding dehydrogenase n=1 Tax=Actinokineospora sp. TaxID=1872133 RepID=UPI003D6AA565